LRGGRWSGCTLGESLAELCGRGILGAGFVLLANLALLSLRLGSESESEREKEEERKEGTAHCITCTRLYTQLVAVPGIPG
jgi:hypothetical protein